MLALTDNERIVLELVAQQGGRASWHSVAILTGPINESPVTLLRGLADRRLVVEGDRGRHAITALGRVALGNRDAVDETALLAEALGASPTVLFTLFPALVAEPAQLAAALEHLVDTMPENRRAAADGLGYLPPHARGPIARRIVAAGGAAALLASFAPPRFNFLGEHPPKLDQPDWDDLLAIGLADPSPEVRGHAAGLVFATDRGVRFAAELTALVPSGDPLVALALAGAGDPASLAALEALLTGSACPVVQAMAAARALAERPDGEAAFARALADPRDDVRGAARFAHAVRGRGRRARGTDM